MSQVTLYSSNLIGLCDMILYYNLVLGFPRSCYVLFRVCFAEGWAAAEVREWRRQAGGWGLRLASGGKLRGIRRCPECGV